MSLIVEMPVIGKLSVTAAMMMKKVSSTGTLNNKELL